jgi:hypothetical protein
MKLKGIHLPGFSEKDGIVSFDHKAAEAKLDLCTKLQRKRSNKVKVSRNPIPDRIG